MGPQSDDADLALAAGEKLFWRYDLGASSARATGDFSIRGHHRDLTWIFGSPDAIDEPIVRGDRKDTMEPGRLGCCSGIVRAVEDDPDLGIGVDPAAFPGCNQCGYRTVYAHVEPAFRRTERQPA